MKWLLASSLVLSLSPQLFAGPCDGKTTNCNTPGTTGVVVATSTASQFLNLQLLNASGAPANDTGTDYWFFAWDVSQGNPASTNTGDPEFIDDGSGQRVRTGAPLQDNKSPTTPGDLMVNGKIQSLKANVTYDIYAQACSSTTVGGNNSLDHHFCSDWVIIYSAQKSKSLPLNPFKNPVKAEVTSVNLNTIIYSTAVTNADVQNVDINMLNVSTAGAVDMYPIVWPGVYVVPVGTAGVSPANFSFVPNSQYRFTGRLEYPHNQFTNAQTPTDFYTTPLDPANVSTASWTHFTATITFTNSAGGVGAGNPKGTSYHMTITNQWTGTLVTSFDFQSVSGAGAGQFGNGNELFIHKFSSLLPGTTYQACVQATNLGGLSWNSSVNTPCINFTTLPLNPTFSVTNVGTSSATFSVTLNPPTGITDYTVEACQRLTVVCIPDAKTMWPVGNSSISDSNIVTMTPNSPYRFLVQLFEGADSSSFLPMPDNLANGNLFTTTPVRPASGSLSVVTPTSLLASWNDSSANPDANPQTSYQVHYCLDSAHSVGCQALVPQTKAIGTSQSVPLTVGVIPETTYYAEVKTVTSGGGFDSTYTDLGSTTTPNQAPSITLLSCPSNGTQATCTVQATDNGALTDLLFHWTIAPAVPNSPPDQSADNQGMANVTIDFPKNGLYTVTVQATDHKGVVPPGLVSLSSSVQVNIGQIPSSISISPGLWSMGSSGAQKRFDATVLDQFGMPIAGQKVTWSLSNTTAGSLSLPNPETFTTFTSGNVTTTDINLFADIAGAQRGAAIIHIDAAGPSFTVPPFGVVDPTGKSIRLTAVASDLVAGSTITYTWSLVSGPNTVSFSPNGTAASGNSVASLAQAGTYVFQCVATDANGSLPESTRPLDVNQQLTSIQVTPAVVTVKALSDQAFTAAGLDQFGQTMSLTNPTWNVDGGGSVNSAGVFHAIGVGQHFRVTATSLGVSGSAALTVVNFDVSGAIAYPTPYKSTQGNVIHFRGLGSDAKIRIYTTSGRQVIELSSNQDTLDWDVKNSNGEKLASGVYFYVIESPDSKKNGKLIIIQ